MARKAPRTWEKVVFWLPYQRGGALSCLGVRKWKTGRPGISKVGRGSVEEQRSVWKGGEGEWEFVHDEIKTRQKPANSRSEGPKTR